VRALAAAFADANITGERTKSNLDFSRSDLRAYVGLSKSLP
jgi:hypothetical protein